MVRSILALMLVLVAGAQEARAQVVQEVIYFISEDGRSYQRYTGLRTNFSGYNLFFEKGETLDDQIYFFPNEFAWDRSNPDNDVIRLQQGDYSYVEQSRFEKELEIADNGDFVFESDRGEAVDGATYGYWNSPDKFSKFVYVWVLPDNLAIVDAKSNREGKWVRRNNSIAWFGDNVNNVSFTLRYRAKTSEALAALRQALGAGEGVRFEQEEKGARLIFDDSILFAPGSAELSADGARLIERLAVAVDFSSGRAVIVEGHTDNTPITGELARTYAGNWELSAARSLAVIRAMEAMGAPGAQLEARAFGEHRPIADNATAEGRARNRRISIFVSGE